MKTNVLNAGYAPAAAGINIAGRVSNGIARLKAKARSQVKNLLKAMDCPIETEADKHYVKCLAACCVSFVFLPFLAVAAYQLFKAQEKEGGRR